MTQNNSTHSKSTTRPTKTTMPSTTEKEMQNLIFAAIGGRRDVRLFRNNVGVAYMGKAVTIQKPTAVRLEPGDVVIRGARRVKFGLHAGSADLVGWRTLLITPAMVGRKIAQFLSLEIKTRSGRVSEEQDQWAGVIIANGGRAEIVRSVDDAVRAVEGGV